MIQFKDKAVELAVLAGKSIMEIYSDEENFQVTLKSDKSPLTVADQVSNKIICEGLSPLGIPIISEENEKLDYKDRKDYDLFWLIDPLDGTKEFIKRNGEFTVNIALIKDNEPIMGIVYLPEKEDLYYAMLGFGAFQEYEGDTVRLFCPEFHWSDRELTIVGSRSHMNNETKEYLKQFDRPRVLAKGSSLKFIEIAKGNAHVYPRIAPTMEWDTAAAQIILQEAGGSTIEYETNHPLRYNKESLLNPSFIAFGNRRV